MTNSDNASLKVFSGQVAGHLQILQLPNGSLVKPSCLVELDFYKKVKEIGLPLLKFMPECYNFDNSWEQIKKKYIPNDGIYINMENLLLPYKRPNIIDLKLGTRLYDDNANEAKRNKMILNASSSTSLETGLKICGLQIQDKSIVKSMKIGKSYGKRLTKDNLPDAILRFLLNVTEKCYCEDDLEKDENEMNKSIFIAPSIVALKFVKAILEKVKELKDILEQCPVRIYGCSLCIVFETINNSTDTNTNTEKIPPFSIHMIDFAHSTCVDPSLGVDTCLLTGINTLINILESFLNQKKVEEEIKNSSKNKSN